MIILIITIPFGIQAFKIASFTIWPFGRTLVKRPEAGAASAIGNVLWFLLAGWWLAALDLIASFFLAITIADQANPPRSCRFRFPSRRGCATIILRPGKRYVLSRRVPQPAALRRPRS